MPFEVTRRTVPAVRVRIHSCARGNEACKGEEHDPHEVDATPKGLHYPTARARPVEALEPDPAAAQRLRDR